MGRKKGIPGLSFSWKRATGITAAKSKIARATGIPTTRAGRQRKVGQAAGCALPLILLILLTFLTVTVFSQEDTQPQPDRWRGLIIDQSTPEDALRILGKPTKDRIGELPVAALNQWVSKKRKEKVFRTIEFKVSDGIQKAFLSFLDNKLVMITLDVKSGTVAPNGLSNIYGVEFYPMIKALDIALFEKDFERNQGKIYPKTYPTVYTLAAVTERSFVSAMISNVPSFMGALGKTMGVPDEPGSFPGKVEFVQIISRTLQNRDGADVLK